MSRDADLLIVGAGPAGSTLAALAARQGLRVVIVERAGFPRDKVCGEFLSAEGCEVLRRLDRLRPLLDAGGRWMSRVRISDRSGRCVESPLPELADGGRNGLGISRALLDRTLLDHAVACGVERLQPWEATRPILKDGRVAGMKLRAVGSRTEQACGAKLVVAADGRRSRLGRLLFPELGDPRRSGPRSWFGLKSYLPAEQSRIEDRIELHLFDGGYAGLGRVEGERINLACMVTVQALRDCSGKPERLFRERMLASPRLRESLGSVDRPRRWMSVGPLRWGVRRPTGHGALFVGDAAGTVDPFSGEGMSHAMRSAELALPAALRAAERGGLDRESAERYDREWRSEFVDGTRRIRRLGRILEHPRIASPLLALLAGPARRWLPRLVAASRSGRMAGHG